MSESGDEPLPARLERVAAALRALNRPDPEVLLVLGSGWGTVAEQLEDPVSMAYGEIPGFSQATVEGHEGRLVRGRLGGREVATLKGRLHLYEGYRPSEVVFPLRALIASGARTVVVTNAAGGINPSFSAGELMLIRDHINLTGSSPLVGRNERSLGPRFPDMSHAYDPQLLELARKAGAGVRIPLREGVYAGVLGPQFETPAEIRMLHALGADAVGMSTVHEVIAARHAGARVLGLSIISNPAAGLSAAPLRHEDVTATVEAAQEGLSEFVRAVCQSLG